MYIIFLFLCAQRTPRSTRTNPLFPDTPRFRSPVEAAADYGRTAELVVDRDVARSECGVDTPAERTVVSETAAEIECAAEMLVGQPVGREAIGVPVRLEEHTSALQSLMRM